MLKSGISKLLTSTVGNTEISGKEIVYDQNEHSSAMTANPILLQKKYSRVIECFAKQQGLSLDAALDFFYHSEVYQLIRDGVSDMHCMSDAYLVDELEQEYNQNME